MTIQEFKPEFERLCDRWKIKVNGGLLSAYHNKLQHSSIIDLIQAINHFTTEGQNFPSAQNISLWMAQNGEGRVKQEGWSFKCKQCDLSFWTHIENLNETKTFKCDSCELYSDKKLTWNGEYLRKQMEQSKARKETYTEI
jgi:hypothetical protein